MITNYEIYDHIEELVATGQVRSFYPSYFTRNLQLPLTDVLRTLKIFIDQKKLVLKYEIVCDESHVEKTVDNVEKILGDEVYCRRCDKKIKIEKNNIVPKYYVNEDYIKYLKEKNTKKKTLFEFSKNLSEDRCSIGEMEKILLEENEVDIDEINKTVIDEYKKCSECDKKEDKDKILDRIFRIKDIAELIEFLKSIYEDKKYMSITNVILSNICYIPNIDVILNMYIQMSPSIFMFAEQLIFEYREKRS